MEMSKITSMIHCGLSFVLLFLAMAQVLVIEKNGLLSMRTSDASIKTAVIEGTSFTIFWNSNCFWGELIKFVVASSFLVAPASMAGDLLYLFFSSLTGLGCCLPGPLLPLETRPNRTRASADPPRTSPSQPPAEQSLISARKCPSCCSRCSGFDRQHPPRPCGPLILFRLWPWLSLRLQKGKQKGR